MSLVLLGILNSQAAAAGGAGAYDLLETVILTADASSVTFTSGGVWANYQHLQVRIVAESTRTNSNADTMFCHVNSDIGSNYSRHRLRGNGSSVSSSGFSSDASGFAAALTSAASSGAGEYGNGVMDLLDINNTSKYTTARILRSVDSGSSTLIDLGSGAWLNTNAVTSLTFTCSNGSIDANSRISIYGIKGG